MSCTRGLFSGFAGMAGRNKGLGKSYISRLSLDWSGKSALKMILDNIAVLRFDL